MNAAAAADIGIVDCHFHVVGSPEQFPMVEARSYTPPPAALQQWRAALEPLGVTHGVVVQPSIYGTDCRLLLQALAEGRGRLPGIAAVTPDVTDEQLGALATAGVRGVRVAHFEPGDPRAMGGFATLDAFDDPKLFGSRLRAHGMHLQLFTDSRLLPAIAERIGRARVPLVIDHMGRTPARLGAAHAGIESMVRLLGEGRIWVKLSGLANISERGPRYDDARAIHEALLAANPEQLVWGSDWPHTKPAAARPDVADLLRCFDEWTASAIDRRRVLTLNPMRLYGMGA